MTWTHFWDMHSGGGQKLDWAHIFIEAPEDEARRVFYARFGRNPDNVTCDCCGEDYSVSESETLELATAYHRGLRALEGRFDEAKREWAYPEGKMYLEPDENPPKGATVERWWMTGVEKGITLAAYLSAPYAPKVIYASDLTDTERRGRKGPKMEKVWVETED